MSRGGSSKGVLPRGKRGNAIILLSYSSLFIICVLGHPISVQDEGQAVQAMRGCRMMPAVLVMSWLTEWWVRWGRLCRS